MVMGKMWLFLIGNGAEIRPLEKGRKCPKCFKILNTSFSVFNKMLGYQGCNLLNAFRNSKQ